MRFIFIIFAIFSNLFAGVGSIVNYVGDVEILRDNKSILVDYKDYELLENDTILTKNNAKAQIIFIDNTKLVLGKNSILKINQYLINGSNSKVDLNAKKGSYDLISGDISKLARKSFKFQANTATIGIRGTRFSGDVNEKVVDCNEGEIDVKVGNKTYNLKKGERLHYKNLKTIQLKKLTPNEIKKIRL